MVSTEGLYAMDEIVCRKPSVAKVETSSCSIESHGWIAAVRGGARVQRWNPVKRGLVPEDAGVATPEIFRS
jgi:hypothetical protein